MRAGGCAVQQQALDSEAAAMVRHAVALARRRGHAQVTPLHVASSMLSAAAALLRTACLRSHSHPLQCKALELCFNVALNRLPTAAAGTAVFHGHIAPVLSNALVAAFKRAQAHLRRGAVEGPPVVDVEQLIISILDDPSVSRVMREAGFSSSQVKANVEKAVSASTVDDHANTTCSRHAKTDNDAMRVLDCMSSGTRRCMVVVGKGAEAAVKAVMDRISKAELQHRHERLKSINLVPLSVASFQSMAREEVEAKASDLRTLVRAAGKGVVLVLEDLAFASEAWSAVSEKRRSGQQLNYCPVEHAVMQVSSLVSDSGGGRFWLLGFGSHPVFMRCRSGQPSLEAVWGMHPVVVPDGGIALSLSCSSEAQANSDYCAAAEMAPMSTIPSWLHRYQDPNHTNLQLQNDLWNPMRSGHHTSELTLSFSPTSPTASPLSEFTHCHNTNMMSSKQPCQLDPRQPWPSNQVHGSTVTMVGGMADHQPKFRELTAENLKIMCNTLEVRIPGHKDVALGIASTVLRCRSGMARRFGRQEKPSSATWLLFQGRDNDAKKAMAHELAKLVFGSYTDFISISTTDSAAPIHSSTYSDELTLKRPRSPDTEHGYAERLYKVMCQNPRQVVMVDNIEQLDHYSEINIKKAIANGRLRGCNGDEVGMEDAIVVLSSEAFDSESRASSPPRVKRRAINNDDHEEEDADVAKGMRSPCFTLDLNANANDGEVEEYNTLDDVDISDVMDGVFTLD